MLRTVLDANVLVSGVISPHGAPGRIIDRWENDALNLVVSPQIIPEIERGFHYPKIQQKYLLPDDYIEKFLGMVANQAIVVNPTRKLEIIDMDPADNRYLE